jgi:ADP-heptose:LPS heptosyltransferase
VKRKLLVLELWGLGDLAIATPFLQAAAEKYAVTLLAKPYALELQPRLWPNIRVEPFNAPWTPFKHKYQLWNWPWPALLQLKKNLRAQDFDCAISGRWDPRDHFLLFASGAPERLGFPRLGSQRFLTQSLPKPPAGAHHSEFWQVLGKALGLAVPTRDQLVVPPRPQGKTILVHSGARLPARVWPLPYFQQLVARLRQEFDAPVQIVCDTDQLAWWQSREPSVLCPRSVTKLFQTIDQAAVFVGNCSGPGHLAAIAGVPTFTIFGPSLPDWFLPMHPAAHAFIGKNCPFRPCADYCHFKNPECLTRALPEAVWSEIKPFITQLLDGHCALAKK